MKKILGILIALMITTKAFASVTVLPTKVEFNANKTKANYLSTSIEIRGDEREVMRFKAYTGYFVINENGEMAEAKSGAPNDISKKIKFVPSEFTVQPGKSQKLRINIPNFRTLPDGESRCALYIEDVNPKEIMLDTGRVGIGAQLIVKTRIAVPVYVDKGKVVKNCEIQDFKLTKEKGEFYVNAKLVSTGNAKIRYQIRSQIINGKKVVKEESLGGGAVGDNNYFITKNKLDTKSVPSGAYTLRYSVMYTDGNGKKQTVKEETEINI